MAVRTNAGPARWGIIRTLFLALRSATRPGSPSWSERAAAVPRLVRATMRGEYAGLSKGRLAGLVVALAYVVSPVDLVPEGLLALAGFADDAVLLAWMAAALTTATEDFIAWERVVRPTAAGRTSWPPDAASSAQPQDAASAAGPQDAPAGAWAPDRGRPTRGGTVPSYVVR